MMTIIARLFRKTNRRRVMSGRAETVFPRSEVNHLKSCNSTARSLPYANAESDNDCHLQCSSSRQPQPQRQQFHFSCSTLLVTSRRYYSLLRLSPFFLRVNEKFSRFPARFFSFFISFNLESLLLHDVKSQSQLTFINF